MRDRDRDRKIVKLIEQSRHGKERERERES